MASIYGKGLRGKATMLHSQVVRARGNGACERCGESRVLQCAHIIPRRYAATRCDPANAWALCAGCHMRLTEHADEHMEFVDDTIGIDAFFELKARAEAGVKANDAYWQQWIDQLTTLLKDAA